LTLFLAPSCLLLSVRAEVAAREAGAGWTLVVGPGCGLIAINAVIDIHHLIIPRCGSMR
jgi:hypothetical protein